MLSVFTYKERETIRPSPQPYINTFDLTLPLWHCRCDYTTPLKHANPTQFKFVVCIAMPCRLVLLNMLCVLCVLLACTTFNLSRFAVMPVMVMMMMMMMGHAALSGWRRRHEGSAPTPPQGNSYLLEAVGCAPLSRPCPWPCHV